VSDDSIQPATLIKTKIKIFEYRLTKKRNKKLKVRKIKKKKIKHKVQYGSQMSTQYLNATIADREARDENENPSTTRAKTN